MYVHFNIDFDVEEYAAIYEDLEEARKAARKWMESHKDCVSRIAEFEIGSNVFSGKHLLQYHWDDTEGLELIEDKLVYEWADPRIFAIS